MKKIILIFLFVSLGVFSICGPGRASDEDDKAMLENVRKMRMRQIDEEGLIRVNKFIQLETQKQCLPVQMLRQRLKEVNSNSGSNGTATENVNITAGHGEVNVTDNHGTINSDINVQIVNQGDDGGCL